MMAMRDVIGSAAATLAGAGIDSARSDAELLAAHAAGVERGRLGLIDPPAGFDARYRELIAERARRVPLQYLTGTAPFGPLLLHVGPGVFIPRPETESLLEWAIGTLERQGVSASPTIVDLCTGSAALAAALAHRWPSATVFGVDDSPAALDYARRNTAGTGVRLVEADVCAADLLPELDGTVDLVVANPPYIPDGAVLEPEVVEHDPHHALFGGPDGMAVIPAVVAHAVRWLRPGGTFAVEHDDTTAEQTVEMIRLTNCFEDVAARTDLAGRPRFVTARRTSRSAQRGN
jgi:release factor glutamine methyltransferase